MGSFSLWHWVIVLVVVMLLFGRGKISELMGDVAKGVNAFKKGLKDDDTTAAKTIDQDVTPSATAGKDKSTAA
jgi:sec-independent protein translocase protein TatA